MFIIKYFNHQRNIYITLLKGKPLIYKVLQSIKHFLRRKHLVSNLCLIMKIVLILFHCYVFRRTSFINFLLFLFLILKSNYIFYNLKYTTKVLHFIEIKSILKWFNIDLISFFFNISLHVYWKPERMKDHKLRW